MSMDIRDIKEEPNYELGSWMKAIFDMQKELISNYVQIEGIPAPPISLNIKSDQTLLKDFTSRIIEELAEGYQSALEVVEVMEKNFDFFEASNSDANDIPKLKNAIQNQCEEQADALHFFVELLLYANIDYEDIVNWVNQVGYKRYPRLKSISEEIPVKSRDLLYIAMNIGTVMLRKEIDLEGKDYMHHIDISERLEYTEKEMNYLSIKYYNKTYTLDEIPKHLWHITYLLNISRNCLKNKPWKQSQEMTNEELYQNLIVEAFICFLGYLWRLGFNPRDVYYLYYKKNRVNLFRIQSKY